MKVPVVLMSGVTIKSSWMSQSVLPVFHDLTPSGACAVVKSLSESVSLTISLRHPLALQSLLKLKSEPNFYHCHIGVSTVVAESQIRDAKEFGASFISTLYYTPRLVEVAKSLDLGVLCGVSTFSSALDALRQGVDALKFYPTSKVSPEKLSEILRALRAVDDRVYQSVPIFIAGGVRLEDIEAYMKAGATHFAIGFTEGDYAFGQVPGLLNSYVTAVEERSSLISCSDAL